MLAVEAEVGLDGGCWLRRRHRLGLRLWVGGLDERKDGDTAEFGVPATVVLAAFGGETYLHWSTSGDIAVSSHLVLAEGGESQLAGIVFAKLYDEAATEPVSTVGVALYDGEVLNECSVDCLHKLYDFLWLIFFCGEWIL